MTNYTEEFREAKRVEIVIESIQRLTTKKWTIMEMCGGQTHAIMRYGLDQLLPSQIEIIHGPGCPVCVTSLELIDKAILIASQPDVIFTSYGDMLRVPGSKSDLFEVRSNGGDVRIVYSALDALNIARENPDKEIVFFGIGFETTAPANGISILQAQTLGIKNYSVLVSQFCVPPAMRMILSSQNNRVQGFLAAGHVCSVMGTSEYIPISAQYHVPISVTGFEPLDLLLGIESVIRMLENHTPMVYNAFSRSVRAEGNPAAKEMLYKLFEPCDRIWRGIGMIPMSGWKLRPEYAAFDAEKKFPINSIHTHENQSCIAGLILQGIRTPLDCPAFGRECTPTHPLGATMVSAEGACSAFQRYKRVSYQETESDR